MFLSGSEIAEAQSICAYVLILYLVSWTFAHAHKYVCTSKYNIHIEYKNIFNEYLIGIEFFCLKKANRFPYLSRSL